MPTPDSSAYRAADQAANNQPETDRLPRGAEATSEARPAAEISNYGSADTERLASTDAMSAAYDPIVDYDRGDDAHCLEFELSADDMAMLQQATAQLGLQTLPAITGSD